jgi:phosphohistidine phosphatase
LTISFLVGLFDVKIAEIFSQYLKVSSRAQDGLNPNNDPKIWFKRLEEIDNVMLVGYLPHQEKNWSIMGYVTPELIP